MSQRREAQRRQPRLASLAKNSECPSPNRSAWRETSICVPSASTTQASFSHFCMKLFLAAPESFLPSALTAFGSHASRLHFFRKLLSAAPARGLPFLSTALLAHVSCAIAGPSAKAAIITARRMRFMDFLPLVNLPFIPKIADPNMKNQTELGRGDCNQAEARASRCSRKQATALR